MSGVLYPLRVFHGWIEANPGTAAWAQAGGSVLAIFAAFYSGIIPLRFQRARDRERRVLAFDRYKRMLFREVTDHRVQLALVREHLAIYRSRFESQPQFVVYNQCDYRLGVSSLCKKLVDDYDFSVTPLGWDFYSYVHEFDGLSEDLAGYTRLHGVPIIEGLIERCDAIGSRQAKLLARTKGAIDRIKHSSESIEEI